MDKEAGQKIVLEFIAKKSKSKSKFYLKDFNALFPEDKPRAVKNLVNDMVKLEILEYWSSGSTTLYGVKGAGKQAAAEHED